MNSLIKKGTMDFRHHNITEFKSNYLITKSTRYKMDSNDEGQVKYMYLKAY